MVRQAENLASNKENFNYLNGNHNQRRDDTEVGGGYAEIDIKKQDIASKTHDEELGDVDSCISNKKVVIEACSNSGDNIVSNGEVEVIENLI